MTKSQTETGLETKVASPGGAESSAAYADFMTAFEAFKDANDERLDQLERRMSADVVSTEKVDRLNAALDGYKAQLDRLSIKAARPALETGIEAATSEAAGEHKQAFHSYMRKGETGDLGRLEGKALSIQSDPDGGYLVPSETETEIGRVLAEASPIRAIAGVRQVSSAVYKKPFAVSGPAAGWVGETAARPETASPALAELQFPAMELYAMPAATQSLLDDAAVNIDQWIADEVRTAFGEQESAAFVNGDGVNMPRGFLNVPQVDDAGWSWGNLGYHVTGAAGAFAATDASDVLLDTVYSLKAGHRQNASWVMNRRTQGEIRKLKDADGNYLWQPATSADGRATLMNFAITEAEDMPDIAADATAIAFGDFRNGYLIVDRMGVRVLRDPYSAKPYVLFYTTKRVGGGVQNFEAIKLVKFGTA
jgi:HK97 family phage major capsid protein